MGNKGGAKGITMSVEDVFDVSGVAVITGGAGGFGLEIGQRCAAAGCDQAAAIRNLLPLNRDVTSILPVGQRQFLQGTSMAKS